MWIVPLLILGTITILLVIHLTLTPVWIFLHMVNSADPFIITDDALQQVWIYLGFYDPQRLVGDPLADYFLTAFIPQGMKYLMQCISMIFDPRGAANFLTYILFFVFTGLVTDTSRQLGGWWAALGTLTFCLGTDFFLLHVTGGLPRNFALPLTALLARSLVVGQVKWLAMSTIIASGFYYVTAAIGGLSMTVLLFLFPSHLHANAQSWSWRKRILMVGFTGLLCIAIFMPSAMGGKKYGPLITPNQYDAYPEAGPDGRYFQPNIALPKAIMSWSFNPLQGKDVWAEKIFSLDPKHPIRKGFLSFLLFLIALGLWLKRNDPQIQRLMILPFVAIVGYQLAAWSFPYLFYPVRYIKFVLPTLFIILLPSTLIFLLSFTCLKHSWKTKYQLGAVALTICLLVSLFFGHRNPRAGLLAEVTVAERPVLNYLSNLPKNVLIAGWPKGAMDNVPFITGQRVLINFETHLMFHQKYVETRRIHMRAIIDALYAVDPKPLLRLGNQFGVTHLVVQPKLLYENCPKYFAPFQMHIDQACAQIGNSTPLLMQLSAFADFQQDGEFLVFDLSTLALALADHHPLPRKNR